MMMMRSIESEPSPTHLFPQIERQRRRPNRNHRSHAAPDVIIASAGTQHVERGVMQKSGGHVVSKMNFECKLHTRILDDSNNQGKFGITLVFQHEISRCANLL